ncbi:hypothetical protein PV11_08076 [Exophiala sideris]|uniref:Uncharacterized protein n=1 Tax=Exophiala sideris TaxID=1016849 RepID=A0A0D1VWE9_9EURO|nr:hypothetical protein PV11_08076 [Exophiala sideris]
MLDFTIRILAVILCVMGIASCAFISEQVIRAQLLDKLPDAEKGATGKSILRLSTTFNPQTGHRVQCNMIAWDLIVTKASSLFTTITRQAIPPGLSKRADYRQRMISKWQIHHAIV